MSNNNEKLWLNIYQNDYREVFKNFSREILYIRSNYKALSQKELMHFANTYLKIFETTVNLFKYFFNCENVLLLEDTRLIIIYILKCNILHNSILLYEIYLEMKKIKKTGRIVAKKYLANKYLDIFVQINKFFESRLETEKNNAFFS